MKVTLVLSACFIPDDMKVTKRNGSKEYVLKKEIRIYGTHRVPEEKQLIKSERVVFLVCPEGSITAISDDTEIAVTMELEEAVNFINELNER